MPGIRDVFSQEPNHLTFFSQVAKELGPVIMARYPLISCGLILNVSDLLGETSEFGDDNIVEQWTFGLINTYS